MGQCAVLIFAKAPYPGSVKTRLIPALGEVAVTQLYIRLLKRLVEWVCNQTPFATELWVTPNREHPLWQQLASAYDLSIFLQQGDDLGARMGLAVQQALTRHHHVALIGVDSPSLTRHHLQQTFRWLANGEDAVLGPVEDGGYVLLGLNEYHQALFEGHDWGGADVAASTRAVLSELGWHWRELPQLWDLDRPQDLERLKREHPGLCKT
jgi:rSAM/selenodomain-associated transferase 1